VGTVGTPDIYEMPRNTVDASITKGLGKHVEVRVGVQDLLNQRTRLVQDADGDGRIGAKDEEVISFRRGAYFSGGISLTF
jgi:outer membrane receptor protein involved in Fe transport